MRPLLATILMDPPTTLMAGAILALICTKLIGRAGMVEVWRGLAWAAGWSAFYVASVGWHFFARSDWMFVYLTDTAKLPMVPAYAMFLFICVGFGVMGYLGVAVLLHLGKTLLAWGTFAAAASSLVMTILLTADRYGRVGTLEQYLAGTAPALADDAGITRAMTGSSIAIAVASVGTIVVIVRRTLKGDGPRATA